ncbi:MAG: hypothetical protein IJH95_02280 [Mogibacterium sp.]|nr:hypothetical protein [Mogibacterium sp.]
MENKISEEKLKEAKEKLACHIQPPGQSSHAAGSSAVTAAEEPFIDPDGTVHLTRMTTAGG